MRAELIDSLDRADQLHAAWDELAVVRGRPYAAPAWLLPWAKWAAPRGSKLALIAVYDRRDLVGVAPFIASVDAFGTTSFRVLGGSTSARVEPLARAGEEPAVAAAIASALAAHHPRADLVHLECVPDDSPWPRLLAHAFDGSSPPNVHTHRRMVAPVITFGEGGFREWFASRTHKFRRRMQHGSRRLARKGARLTMSTPEHVGRNLEHFIALHRSRWQARGGSRVLTRGVERMLPEVARRLAPPGRFRLWMLEIDGRPVASEAMLSAGGEVEAWLGGFDDAWHRYSPSLQTLMVAVEDAWGQGDRRFHLGAGGETYKFRFANDEEWCRWLTIVPPGRRSARTLASLLRLRAYYGVAATLSPRHKALVRRLTARYHSGDELSSALDQPTVEPASTRDD